MAPDQLGKCLPVATLVAHHEHFVRCIALTGRHPDPLTSRRSRKFGTDRVCVPCVGVAAAVREWTYRHADRSSASPFRGVPLPALGLQGRASKKFAASESAGPAQERVYGGSGPHKRFRLAQTGIGQKIPPLRGLRAFERSSGFRMVKAGAFAELGRLPPKGAECGLPAEIKWVAACASPSKLPRALDDNGGNSRSSLGLQRVTIPPINADETFKANPCREGTCT